MPDSLLAKIIHCIPLDQDETPGICVLTGRPATKEAVFAKAIDDLIEFDLLEGLKPSKRLNFDSQLSRKEMI